MKMTCLAIAGAALLLAGGWYVGAAAPDRRFEAALRALRANDAEDVQYRLLTVEPDANSEGKASLLRGWLMLQSPDLGDPGRISAILDELNDAATDDEENRALALALLGRARYKNGQLADALILLEESLQKDPDEVEAHRWAGIVLYELGLYIPALPHLEEVARREPHSGRPHRLLGIIHRERGAIVGDAYALQAAVDAYRESLKRDPDQYDADEIRVELGRCLIFRNEWDEALEAVRPCFDSPGSLSVKAECYYAQGRIERADECLDLALEQNPNDAHALSVKATLAMAKRDVDLATTLLERAVQEKPRDYNLRYRLVQAYNALGNKDAAAPHVEQMDALLKMGEEQKDLTRKALTDSDPALRYRLADLSAELGEPEMAESWRKAAEMLDSPLLKRMMTPPAEASKGPATQN